MVYKMTFTPMLEDYGRDLRLSAEGILKLFENIATRHGAAVGDTVEACLARGEAWVLCDWYVEISSRTPMGERVRVETFCRKADRPTAFLRDCRMCDGAGNEIARSTSKWALVNTNTGRIIPADDAFYARYGVRKKSVFETPPALVRHGRLPCTREKEIVLRRTDFDVHEHVHNLEYLNFAFDVIPRAVYLAHAVKAFHIRYLKPICGGERVFARCAETEWGYAVFIEADGALAATVDLWTEHF